MSVAAYLERAARLAAAACPGLPLQRILDRAMAGDDGAPVLAPGEGTEARRLLGLVRWDDVEPRSRRHFLMLISHEPWWREHGFARRVAEDAAEYARIVLTERGLLAEQQKGRAA